MAEMTGDMADLRLPTPQAARAELTALGVARRTGEGVGLDVAPPPAPATDGPGELAVLASWRQLLDVGTLQRDEPALAGTARLPLVRIGPEAAARLGVVDGDRVTVSGATGSISLPVQVTPMPDHVVWVPMRSPGSDVRGALGAGPGSVVRLSQSSSRPTIPAGGVL
jgi:NADH-quinone oxidoreductase subunit G